MGDARCIRVGEQALQGGRFGRDKVEMRYQHRFESTTELSRCYAYAYDAAHSNLACSLSQQGPRCSRDGEGGSFG